MDRLAGRLLVLTFLFAPLGIAPAAGLAAPAVCPPLVRTPDGSADSESRRFGARPADSGQVAQTPQSTANSDDLPSYAPDLATSPAITSFDVCFQQTGSPADTPAAGTSSRFLTAASPRAP